MPTGGYVYARRVLDEWAAQEVAARIIPLPESFPNPTESDLEQTAAVLEGVSGPLLIDGLAFGAFPEYLARKVGPRSNVLLHHPLCDEQGLAPEVVGFFEQRERIALQHAAQVVATSPSTARSVITKFNVPETRVYVAIPGTDPAPQSMLSNDPPRIIAVGSVTPRKGYGVLIEALAVLRDLSWRCEIFGSLDRDAKEVQRLSDQLVRCGLQGRIVLRGAVSDDAIANAYLNADMFVAPSLHEGYGMAVVEAMAHGLPVVATRAGALAETAPCAELCAPNDFRAFAASLRPLLESKMRRISLGASCRSFAESLPSWGTTARLLAKILS